MKYVKITDEQRGYSYQFTDGLQHNMILNGFVGWEYPTPIVSVDDVAILSAVGVHSKFGRRLFSFTINLTCDFMLIRDQVIRALNQNGRMKLIEFETLDGKEVQCYAYVNKFNAEYVNYTNAMYLEFVAPDYRFYSQEIHTEEIARNSSGDIINIGSADTFPMLRIHGPFTGATITNLLNGLVLEVDTTITSGEYIEIDCMNETAVLNDGTPMFSAIGASPNFIRLDAGTNPIQFEDTGGGSGTSLEVIYRDAWIGV